MIHSNQIHRSFAATLSAAMLLITAPVALADPQGYRLSVAQNACAAGLNPSAVDYAACVKSLDRVLADTQITNESSGGIGLDNSVLDQALDSGCCAFAARW
jgi:hypothetical protein